MAIGLIGRKIGMTQVHDGAGRAVPVTIIEAGPCPIVQRRTKEMDGYEALQLGFMTERKRRQIKKPMKGHFERAKVPYLRHLQEIRIEGDGTYQVGQVLTVELFSEGEYIKVTGTSKGKGFQGGMKRHGWRGGPASHGAMFHRKPGSIGASSFPSRVLPGHRMPGRMGGDRVTVKGLRIIKVIPERNLLVVKGAVPGPPGGILTVVKDERYASHA
ncbi:MAG: 50S ribosomal protein L3 [candidate division NC10 bacterium]|nr:50S ribosomal protein L3 [candidate division NC10 bacterium]